MKVYLHNYIDATCTLLADMMRVLAIIIRALLFEPVTLECVL